MTAERPEEESTDQAARPREWTLRAAWPFPSVAEIEARFEELLRRRWAGEQPAQAMPADVFTLGRELLIELELPGVDQETLRVRLESGALLVEAHRPPTAREDDLRPARLERTRGPLRRRVPLPTRPRAGRLDFRLEAGVLRVRVLPDEGEEG